MKKLFLFLLTASLFLNSQAQIDSFVFPKTPFLTMDVGLMSGVFAQEFSQIDLTNAYGYYLNDNISKISCNNRKVSGFNISIAYFLTDKHQWAITTGLMTTIKKYDLTVDNFRIEYKSFDYNNDVFRQVLTAKGAVSDQIKSTNISLPLGVRFVDNLKGKLGYSCDFGFLLTLSNTNKYTSGTIFDYEAIYKFDNTGTPVFDETLTPSKNDWLITQDKLTASQIDVFRQQGYNVGLAVASGNSGNVTYKSKSLGWYFQPTFTYRATDNMDVLCGAFFIKQAFTNNDVSADYRTTDKVNDYSSLLNAVSKTKNFSYGINIGVRYFFTKRPHPVPPPPPPAAPIAD
jgi:hypothetical protein